jgi:hypothetical protein
VVVDVRPDDRIPERDEQKFAVTAEACEAAGWDYLRSGDLDPGDGRGRAVAVALPAPAVPGAGGRRGPAGGFRRVLSVDRGEEPQQAETSTTRALTLSRPAPSREQPGTSPAPGARRRGEASRR